MGRPHGLWLAAAVVLGCASEVRAKEPTAVTTWDTGDSTCEGVVEVAAPPAAVYAAATDYAHWPTVLTDVTSVEVRSGGRDDAVVRFASRTLKHTVTVRFGNEVDRALRFRLTDGPPGTSASGEYLLEPLDGGRRTRVHARFMLHVGGIARLAVSSSTVRRMRVAKVVADLTDIARRFP